MVRANNMSKIITKSMFIIALAYFSQYSFIMCIVALFLLPAIVSSFVCSHGVTKAVYTSISAVVFCVFIALTRSETDIIANVIVLLCTLVPGVIIGICFVRKYSFADTMIINCVFDCTLFIFVLIMTKFIYDTSIAAEMQDFFSETFNSQLMLVKSLYPSYAEQIDAMEHQIFNMIYIALPGMIPFVAFLVFIGTFVIKYAICKSICVSQMIKKNIFSDGFDTFRPTVVTDIALAICVLGAFTASSMKWFMICINVILIIMVLFFITFISIIDFKLKEHMHNTTKRVFSIAAIFAISIMVSIFMPVVNFIYIFILIGILDSFFDFRKLSSKKGEINEK